MLIHLSVEIPWVKQAREGSSRRPKSLKQAVASVPTVTDSPQSQGSTVYILGDFGGALQIWQREQCYIQPSDPCTTLAWLCCNYDWPQAQIITEEFQECYSSHAVITQSFMHVLHPLPWDQPLCPLRGCPLFRG